MGRALRPSTPGDFLPDEKVTKESPRGGYPLWALPPGGLLSSPQQRKRCSPQKRAPTCTAKIPRGCHKLFTPATNTARAESRGIKGGYAPFAGGPGTRRFLVSLCLLSSHKKVGRVQGGAPASGGRDYRPAKAPGARGGAPAGGCRGHRPAKASGEGKNAYGRITSLPPIYIRSGSGMRTEPSSLRLFSKNAISMRGGATTVLLRVCGR